MGLDAWFDGFWTFDKPLTKEQIKIVNDFIKGNRKTLKEKSSRNL